MKEHPDKWSLLEDYLRSMQLSAMDDSTTLSKNTLDARRNDLSQFLRSFEDPFNVTTAQLRDWLLSHKGTKWKRATTFIRKISSLKLFYKFLFADGYVDSNPATALEYPRKPRNFSRTALTAQQLNRVLICAEAPCMTIRDKAIFYTLISSGLRASELCNTLRQNVNLSSRMIYVPKENNKGRKVDKRVPIGFKAKQYIEQYIAEDIQVISEYLFHREDGRPLNRLGVYYIIQDIISRAFPNESEWSRAVGPHLLRHCFATMWLENGGDRTTLQHVMGYTSQREIETYAKACSLSPQFINSESQKVTRAFRKKHKL